MTPPLRVGNDVVDRTDPRCAGKAADERFVTRVFDPAEAEAIRAAADPDLALWLRWAGKEAAFKVVTKLRGEPPPFEHAAFVVEVHGSGDGEADGGDDVGDGGRGEGGEGSGSEGGEHGTLLRGTVLYRSHRVRLRALITPRWLHVVALPHGNDFGSVEGGVAAVAEAGASLPDSPASGAWASFLEGRFSEAERASVHSLPSAVVRLRARQALARRLGREEADLEIVCTGGPAGRTPPEVLVCGTTGEADVSLSHHGRWVGWALTGAG